MTDPISDMLVRIKNAQRVGHEEVVMPSSKMKFAIAQILEKTGYVSSLERRKKKTKKSEHELLAIVLKYSAGQPALSDMRMISKPSRRMYVNAKEIKPVRSGHGISIISTSKGVMSSRDAQKAGVGGEIICEIW